MDLRDGSSPRVRGRPASVPVLAGLAGLIPAGAGQTPGRWRVPAADRGSSPRVRGRLRQDDLVLTGLGLIPAGAGQTLRNQQGCVD